MSLGSRIKEYRIKAGLSQEKLAEKLDISRQAVTKWESDRSSPSTENLISLASILGVTVDMLISSKEEDKSIAEQLFKLQQQENAERKAQRIKRIKKGTAYALLTIGVYITIYLLDRFINGEPGEFTVTAYLFSDHPSLNCYTVGWLLGGGLFFICMGISALPALFGKWRFSAVTATGFSLGILAGELFGPYPPGVPYGHGHYGWAIWLLVYLFSIAAGIILEVILYRRAKARA